MRARVDLVPTSLPWVDSLPGTWSESRGKHLFVKMQRPIRPEDEVVTAFRDGQVTLRSLRRADGYTFSNKEIGYQGIRRGDLVIHQMDAFAGAIGVSEADGKSTPVYTVLQPAKRDVVDNRYYMYLIRHLAKSDYILSLAKGIRERSTDFRWAELAELELPVPPLMTQQGIVAFLDSETTRIDALIERKLRLIDLLVERRVAHVRHLVLGAYASAELRDTGVKWLGAVPSHWRTLPLHVLFREHRMPNVSGFEKNLLSLSYGRIVRKDINSSEGLLPASFDGYNVVDPDDIVLRLTDLQNDQKSLRTGLVTERGIVTSAYVTLRQAGRTLDPRFAAYLLHAYDVLKVFYAQGAGVRQTMKFADLRRIPLVVPPMSEQVSIGDALDQLYERTDRVVNSTKRSIDLLREYRAALISAAVTGQIELSGTEASEEVA